MADFAKAFEKTIANEGGYKLHTVEGDRGGMTFAGIARRPNPQWAGWKIIDRGETESVELSALVRAFYRDEFWARVRGDEITDQAVAETIYDFAVNAGVVTAVKLAQIVVGVVPDGVVGPKTLAALTSNDEREFVLSYALAKVGRYVAICKGDRTQIKFLMGWLNRTLKAVA